MGGKINGGQFSTAEQSAESDYAIPSRAEIANSLAESPTQDQIEQAIRLGQISVSEALGFAFRAGYVTGSHTPRQHNYGYDNAPDTLPVDGENADLRVDVHNHFDDILTKLYLKKPLLPPGI